MLSKFRVFSLSVLGRRIRLAIVILEAVLRLLGSWPRLRKEADEAIDAASLAYNEAWEALADRELTRDEVAEVRKRLEAFGRETEEVLQLLAHVLGIGKEK
ncbi:MAG: hypothetical protein HYX93_02225 [Chloroflexi bacterium]|nr:hypothetical protein [Chloroflexota bacterium]